MQILRWVIILEKHYGNDVYMEQDQSKFYKSADEAKKDFGIFLSEGWERCYAVPKYINMPNGYVKIG